MKTMSRSEIAPITFAGVSSRFSMNSRRFLGRLLIAGDSVDSLSFFLPYCLNWVAAVLR